ncbi:Alpha-mannosidase I MNS5 [Glycine max]|nr:Alpha-mannosidase I MNS5 [Glycine max]
MFPPRHYTTCLLLFLLVLSDFSISESQSPWAAKKKRMRDKVRNMFYHAYDNYMTHAFPHDELKPISKTFTNSLSELGNLKLEHLPQDYNGSALTLIESLSSLVIMGNYTEFERAVLWLSENLTFDVDARINLFECNIRVLGGLVSAHLLASDSSKKFFQGAYKNQLLALAEDLGKRFLPAFNTPTGLPYAWINLKYGVMENETTETSTSGCGSLILEMGALSKMTGDPIYESVALRALRKLWSMQSTLKLFGTTLDVTTGQWIEYSSGIGAGVDSFYEYLLKAHILFGKEDFWKMFHSAYVAVQKYFRHGPWFLLGMLLLLIHLTGSFFMCGRDMECYRRDPWYIEVGESIVNSLNLYTKVEGGFASIKDVTTMQLEDHQHSFFLAETCKYLYLLFDDSFVHENNYVFTTEGHPLPVLSTWHEELPEAYIPTNWTFVKRQPRVNRICAMSLQVCPAMNLKSGQHIESACHIPDARSDYRCLTDEDCGVDATTCRPRSCSIAGYCGLWLII